MVQDIWLTEAAETQCEQPSTLAGQLLNVEHSAVVTVLESTLESLQDTSDLFDIDLGGAEALGATLERATNVLGEYGG